MAEQESKKDKIIDAALRRFSHFGIPKTTMNEIAEDLNISKALLYYYFPDKISLIIEVARHIIADMLEELSQAFLKAKNIREGLEAMTEVRMTFGRNFYMLKMSEAHLQDTIRDERAIELMKDATDKENIILAQFLEEGIHQGEVKETDTEALATLINSVFKGIWHHDVQVNCMVHKDVIPSQEFIQDINKKYHYLINMICDGILTK